MKTRIRLDAVIEGLIAQGIIILPPTGRWASTFCGAGGVAGREVAFAFRLILAENKKGSSRTIHGKILFGLQFYFV